MSKDNKELKIKAQKNKNQLRVAFIAGIALILIIAISLVVVLEYLIVQVRLARMEDLENNGLFLLIMFGVSSVIIGLAFATILEKFILRPIDELLEGMKKLGDGEFSTRIDMGKIQYLSDMSESFNKLANELQNTEILRSDFVNSFSHELKTPIVSVSGLIGLMKNEDLPKEKRVKYLEIIEEEMDRLVDLTTNMLNLSRIEKQEILTDKTKYNLSEQIRTCVLLLEKKWQKKQIEFSLEFDEFDIVANEDMLKQVWINLLDNAIKFSNEKSMVVVRVEDEESLISVSIENTGRPISESDKAKIFNKFFRGQNTLSGEGNGIGLSIVKNIVDKHGGSILLNTSGEKTEFIVKLKKKK